ncbi:hypothetical protein ACS0TY_009523 [Phlomoides rotata]
MEGNNVYRNINPNVVYCWVLDQQCKQSTRTKIEQQIYREPRIVWNSTAKNSSIFICLKTKQSQSPILILKT